MVVHGKGNALASVDRMDLWLREICRRVAAGYRRRAGHRLEVLGWDDTERPDPGAAERADEPDHGPMLALLRRALNHLDDESRDLLALHDVGEMPLSELARLVAHDRKTVRSRLVRARRRVSHWVSGGAAPGTGVRSGVGPRITPAASPFMRDQAARGRVAGCAASELADPARLARALQRRARERHRVRLARAADRRGHARLRDGAGAVHAGEVRRGDRLPGADRADAAAAGARRPPEDRRRAGGRSDPTSAPSPSCCWATARASINRSSRG